MIISNEKIHIFEKTRILSRISESGFIVMIDGTQLLYELNNDGERTFTGYTSASSEDIQRIFGSDSSCEVMIGQDSTTIYEKNKGKVDMYIFTLVSTQINEENAEVFCQKILGERFFNADKIAFVPSVGIIDLCGGWEKFKDGELETPGDFEMLIKEEPMRIIGALNKMISNSYMSMSEDTIRIIKKNKDLVAYSDRDMVRYLMNTIMKRNPSKISILRRLELLQYLIPELDCAFSIKNDLPDFKYENLGEGCMAAINGLDETAAWAVIFYCAGKATSPQEEFGEFTAAVDFLEKSMVIANDFLDKTGYSQDYILDVLSILFLLDANIPDDYDELLEFILKNFDQVKKVEDYEQARQGIVNMYMGKYQETETAKINNFVKLAEATERAWIRNNISVTDEEISEAVGKENLEAALLKIKHFLVEEPLYNTKDDLIVLITKAPIQPLQAAAAPLSPNVLAMIEERKRILKRIGTFDLEKVNEIAFRRRVNSPEEKAYAKDYFDCSERLSELNDELLKTNALSEAERELVSKCQNMNKILNERAEEQRFIDSIFTDTDTSFFENVYNLSISQ